MKSILHVSCGHKRKDRTTRGFNTRDWKEIRQGIDASVQPDVIDTMADKSAVKSSSVDAIYSSHNIEHLYPHEVPLALSQLLRVLKPTRFFVITCPDLQSVCALIAEEKLTGPPYSSPAGPIEPLEIVYGLRTPLERGNLFMAHLCGFNQKVLTGTFQAAGFATVAAKRRGHPYYGLWALDTVSALQEDASRVLAPEHFQ